MSVSLRAQEQLKLNETRRVCKENKLSGSQKRLLTKMSHLYEQNRYSDKYLNDIRANQIYLKPHQLSSHMASMAFNTNIISGLTTNLISQTVILSNSTYCYGLTGRPWEFVVHSTFYNFPVALIDTRSWQLYPRVIIEGFTIELPFIALQLKLHVLSSDHKREGSLFNKLTITSLKLNILLWRLICLIVYTPLRFFRMRQRRLVSHILKKLAKATPLHNLNHDIQPEENLPPIENSCRIGVATKHFNSFGHYIWNDALGIVTTSLYAPLLQPFFLIEGPWDNVNDTQLLNTPARTVKISKDTILNGYWCSYPVLALTAYPILPLAANQLASQLTNSNALSNSSELTSIMNQSIVSDKPRITQSTLYVVFTLRLGGRAWLNSLEAISSISSFLASFNSNISFLIDGMTYSSKMEEKSIETMRLEVAMSSEIQTQLHRNGCDCHVITGLDLQSKMSYYNLSALFIQTLGSGDIIPHLILRKPLIGFGPPSLILLADCIFKAACGSMPPFIALEVEVDPNGTGYTVNPEQVIKAIMDRKELRDLLSI